MKNAVHYSATAGIAAVGCLLLMTMMSPLHAQEAADSPSDVLVNSQVQTPPRAELRVTLPDNGPLLIHETLVPESVTSEPVTTEAVISESVTPDPTFLPIPADRSSTGEWQAGDQPDYWIVSSRQCREYGSGYLPECRLQFYRGAGTHLRCGTIHELIASLEPSVPVCLVVHGSLTTWSDARKASPQVHDWFRNAAGNRRATFIFFTWPSESPATFIPTIDVGILGRRAAYHGYFLAQFLSQLPADRPLSLVGHSHGARTVASAMHLLGGGQVQGLCLHGMCPRGCDGRRRIRVVLAAAAIDNNWLNPGERYGRALSQVELLVNLINRDDFALAFYPWRRLFSRAALARTGFTPSIRSSMGAYNCKLSEFDVTCIVGTGHFWQHYQKHPLIARAIAPTVFYADERNVSAPSTSRVAAPARRRINGHSGVHPPIRETFGNIRRHSPSTRF